ncbi:metal-dependent transcriptional regulator [Micropruina sp.]|uniref:metal-dependent transcriptional regulator n=1 Tax=Micropruina sp. TaxID=2737536 RepID=UPI0026288589|nr:metal-dependent transcriptional regulator [Micropruina sp.]
MSDLIDTTEMYLRTIYELGEEGVPPLRARIAERLKQSGPTVSQTVARMERDGLLTVDTDRQLRLSPAGLKLATRVMRRHRLAERLLIDVIGLDWVHAHDEACRWEHVISTDVERRLVHLLHEPVESPYGNPIPALAELGAKPAPEAFLDGAVPLSEVLSHRGPVTVTVRRFSEYLQTDQQLLTMFAEAGVMPEAELSASMDGPALVLAAEGREPGRFAGMVADHLFVASDA